MPSFEGEPTPEQRQQNAAELFKSLIAVASDHDQKIQKLFELLPEIRDAMLARAEEAVDAAFGATREDVASDAEKRIGEASARISVALNQRIDEQVKAMRGLKKQGDTELAAMRATVEQARPLLAQLADKLAAEAVALSDTQRAEVERIVSSERVKFAESVSGIQLQLRGAYGYGVVYRVGDIVSWRGSSYVASVNGELGEPKFDSKEWQILAMRGVAGADGSGGGDATAAITAHNTDPDAHAALFAGKIQRLPSTWAEVESGQTYVIDSLVAMAVTPDRTNVVVHNIYTQPVFLFLGDPEDPDSFLEVKSGESVRFGFIKLGDFPFGFLVSQRWTPLAVDGNGSQLTGITAAQVGAETTAQLDARDTANRARANHTGTQAVSTISPVSSSSLIGRHAGGSGAAQEVSVGNGLEFSGSGIRRQALTGDVTASAGSNATAIALDVVTNAKLANVATATVKGRLSAGTGDPEDVTIAALKTAVGADPATDTTAGVVTGNFSRTSTQFALAALNTGLRFYTFTVGTNVTTGSGTGALDSGMSYRINVTNATAGSILRRTGVTNSIYAMGHLGAGELNAANWGKPWGASARFAATSTWAAGNRALICFMKNRTLGFGLSGADAFFFIEVDNLTLTAGYWDGTAATRTASLATLSTAAVAEVMFLGDGAGNVQVYYQGTLAATLTGAPTTLPSQEAAFNLELENTGAGATAWMNIAYPIKFWSGN